MRILIALALVAMLSAPALAGDGHFRDRRGSTRAYLSQSHIVGGRSVGSDYSRPYYGRGYGSSYRRHRGGDTTIIIIERPSGYGRRWR